MEKPEAMKRGETAIHQISKRPDGRADLGLVTHLINKQHSPIVGFDEALNLFRARIEELDLEANGEVSWKRELARQGMEGLVTVLETIARNEHRSRKVVTTVDARRFVVLSDRPGKFRLIRPEFGIFSGYVSREFDQREEAEEFADSQQAKLGPLRVLDRNTNEVVYISVAGRRSAKPPWP
jgi:hypothetical protein